MSSQSNLNKTVEYGSTINQTEFLSECNEETYYFKECFDKANKILSTLQLTNLTEVMSLPKKSQHFISSLYFGIGWIKYFGYLTSSPDLPESICNFIISSYFGNPYAEYKLYIIIHNDGLSQVTKSKEYISGKTNNKGLNQITQTSFYRNINFTDNTTILPNYEEIQSSISLSFLFSSSLAHYEPAMTTLAYKYYKGYGLTYSCNTAIKYYKESAYETIKDITKRHTRNGYNYISGFDNEYIEKQFSSTNNENINEIIDFGKVEIGNGNTKYISELATLYLLGGNGIQKDLKEAFNWFQYGAKLNDGSCIYNLGELYLNGWGTDVDYEQAFDGFNKSIQANYSKAYNSGGYMYYYGYGVEKNVKRAYDYFKKSFGLDKNEMDGYYNMITLLGEDKYGIDPDFSTAYKYANLIASQGHTYGAYFYAMLNQYKIGSLIDSCDITIEFFKIVSERNIKSKIKFDNGIDGYYKKKYKQSFGLFLEGGEEGNEIAQLNSGILLRNYPVFADKQYQEFLKFKLFKTSAKTSKHAYALINVGDMYYNGNEGGGKSYQKALKYYKKAYFEGNHRTGLTAHAGFDMGIMYNFGGGTHKNVTKALVMYNETMKYDSSAKYPAYIMGKYNEGFNNIKITQGIKNKISNAVWNIIKPDWKVLMFASFYGGFLISLYYQKDSN